MKRERNIRTRRFRPVAAMLAVAATGGLVAYWSRAAEPIAAFETESGTRSGGARLVANGSASGGSVVQFAAALSDDELPASVKAAGNYTLKWSDDFEGSAVDTSKWNVLNKSNYGSGNNEDECYTSANATVAGGLLNLTAKRETVSGCGTNPQGGSNYYWTSGALTTRAMGGSLKYAFTEGYAQVKLKAPRGNPYWPAFWLVSSGESGEPGWPDYGEFDVVELYGGHPDSAYGTLHYSAGGHVQTWPNQYNVATKAPNSNQGIVVPPLATGAANDWHTYGLLWTSNRLTWYVDGVPYQYFDGSNNTMYTVSASGTATAMKTTSAPSANFWGLKHSIILNLAFGGGGPAYHGYTGYDSASGYTNGNLTADQPGAMQVDYVRIWQK